MNLCKHSAYIVHIASSCMHSLQTLAQGNFCRPLFLIYSVSLFRFVAWPSLRTTSRCGGGLGRALLLSVHRNFSTHNGAARGGPGEAPRLSSPSLSPFSIRVRELLLKFPKTSKAKGSGNPFPNHEENPPQQQMRVSERQATEEDLLMWLAATPNTSAKSALHPLLCLRVLERLGYVMCQAPTSKKDLLDLSDPTASSATAIPPYCTSPQDSGLSLPSEAASRAGGGWLSRHRHLSLASSPLQLRNIVENILIPLEDLIGDSSRNGKSHPQIAPVVHIALEWWCTLPYSSRLPVDRWLPRLAGFYSLQGAKFGQSAHIDARPPPITFLLPYFVEKVRVTSPSKLYYFFHDDRSSGSDLLKMGGDEGDHTTNPIRKALVQLFTLFLSTWSLTALRREVEQCPTQGDSVVEDQRTFEMPTTYSQQYRASQSMSLNQEGFPFACIAFHEERERTLPSIALRGPLLADIFFWQGASPLIALPLIADSLHEAAISLFSSRESQSSEVGVRTRNAVSAEGKGELPRGQKENEGVVGQGPGTISLSSSVHQTCNSAITLQITIHDDDTFRKLLLRLSSAAAGSALCDATGDERAKGYPLKEGFTPYQVLSFIEPVTSFGQAQEGQKQPYSIVNPFNNIATGKHGEKSFHHATNRPIVRNGAAEVDVDIPLRWINPLHDYLITTYTTQTSRLAPCHNTMGLNLMTQNQQRPLQLSFVGIVNVLTAVLERFGQIREESGCAAAAHRGHHSYYAGNAHHASAPEDSEARRGNNAIGGVSPGSYTLLPEKQRVHALKQVCEMLLHHARGRLRPKPPLQQRITECNTVAEVEDSNETKPNHLTQWFPDVSVVQQEAILRRMCGACRALVRVVMEEKRYSLLLEGPEGAAANAGGASSSRLSNSHDSLIGVAFSSDRPPQPSKTFAEVLRNTAFRILEPSLWRYYTECMEWEPQRLSFTNLQTICRVGWPAFQTLEKAMQTGRAKTFLPPALQSLPLATRGADLMYLSTIIMDMRASWKDQLLSFSESAAAVYSNMGGAAAWQTALHILRNPLQQSVHAVIEGIRLVCLHSLLFHSDGENNQKNAENSEPMPFIGKQKVYHDEGGKSAHSGGYNDENALLDVVQAFFCVWKRNEDAAKEENLISVDAALQSSIAAIESVSGSNNATPNSMSVRLLLLVYLTLQCHLLRNSTESTASCRQYVFSLRNDPLVVAFHSLEALFPPQTISLGSKWAGAAALNPPKPSEGFENLHDGNTTLPFTKSYFFPLIWHPFGHEKLTRWEFIEELRGLFAETSSSRLGGDVVTWHWLGTPAAVRRAIRARRQLASTALEKASVVYYFLLPWRVLAMAQHPLRLYDESEQSARAAEVFAQELQSFLASSCDILGSDHMRRETTPAVKVVVRLVSAMEEVQHFALLSESGKRVQSVMVLAKDIQVINAEVALEEGLQAGEQNSTLGFSGVVSTEGQDEGEEDDGLD